MNPLLVGLKGKVFPLEELLEKECKVKAVVKGRVDPLYLEEKCKGKNLSTGFTTNYSVISAFLLATPLVAYLFSEDPTPVMILLAVFTSLNMGLYSWYRSIRVEGVVNGPDKEGYYEVVLRVYSWRGTRIRVVDEPPIGDVVGSTIAEGTGMVVLRYSWRPLGPGEYSWSPRLILAEDPASLIRIDVSGKLKLSVSVKEIDRISRVVEGYASKSSLREKARTIREPVIDRVRPYVPGDKLKDIVPRSIISSSGLAVKEYEGFYEETSKPRRLGLPVIVLGELSIRSNTMLRRLIAYALRYVEDKALVIVEPWNRKFYVDKNILGDILVQGLDVLEESMRVEQDALQNMLVAVIDPSVKTIPEANSIVVVLACDWRVAFLESYRSCWDRYRVLVEETYRGARVVE